MKIQIASDLHLDLLERFAGFRAVEPADADVLLLAGDIHHHTSAIDTFRDWSVPVIYVHGNHELYHAHADAVPQALRSAAEGTNVHYLDCGAVELNGVRFLGCCLWTDYRLYSEDTAPAMQEAEKCMHDHRMIQTDDGLFTPQDAARIHARHRAWLETQLDIPFEGPTVVVTHHAPHAKSVHPRYEGSIVSPAFASDLTPLLQKADLWIHGHVHDSFDYTVDGVRVIANPRGYALNRRQAESIGKIQWENPHFDPRLVIDVA